MPNPLYTHILNIYDLVWLGFIVYQLLYVIYCQILFIHIYQIYMVWFDWVLWYINHCILFNAKSSTYIYIKYSLVGFYGISTILTNSILHPLYRYIWNIYMICKHISLHTVKWFQVLLSSSYNLRLVICLHTVLFVSYTGPYQVQSLWVKVGAMAMKRYSAFPKSPKLELHHQI